MELKPFNADEANRTLKAGFTTSSPWAIPSIKKPWNFKVIEGMNPTTREMLGIQGNSQSLPSGKVWNKRR